MGDRAPATRVNHTRIYRDGALVEDGFPAGELHARLSADERNVGWLDLCRPNPEELSLLADQFGLHPLAVEDILQQAQRAKLDHYDTHLFLNTYVALLGTADRLSTGEVSAFITDRLLVTVRYDDQFDVVDLMRRWDESAELARNGVSYLLYGLLDALIDGHFEAVQRLDSALEKLQDDMFQGRDLPRNNIQRRVFLARRDLVRLRQIALPMREVVNAVLRPTVHLVTTEMIPYYQDVYDHVIRVIEWTESLRDLNTTMLETNLMLQNNQMNAVVKQVTGWAAVIAVPTAVTGFFGQNLNFPWRHTPMEFYISVAVTLGLALLMYVIFRVKKWL
ncbi:magnesium transporter CorA family protein [Micromonospora sp. NPDC049559]|uniref:magnesium transporter CorA family protein n=1 Tax=Micromonospora sp. NPDC049559 TaxID=3155923 RepID=UPI00343B9397